MYSSCFFGLTALTLCFSSLYAERSERLDRPVIKKSKAHYAGVRAPAPKEAQGPKKKHSSKIKNQWVASTTHPKGERKQNAELEIVTLEQQPEEGSIYVQTAFRKSEPLACQYSAAVDGRVDALQQEVNQLRAVTYPQGGFIAPEAHVYATAEWLYFRARQEGMQYATGKSLTFDFSSGFRAGLGVHLPYDGWDIYVDYTWLKPEGSSSVHQSTFPLLLYQATANVSEAHGKWKIDFQTVDLEIGRVYTLARTLTFRPYFGMKGAWIDQDARFSYSGGFISAGQSATVHAKNDFKAAGPLIGCQSNWHLGEGFSFFGDIAASLLFGQFKNSQKQYLANGTQSVDLNPVSHLMSPNLQLVAGIAWDRNFNKDRCHFGIRAGFEGQMYWNQNQIERFTTASQPIYLVDGGDLALYGLTLGARFDF